MAIGAAVTFRLDAGGATIDSPEIKRQENDTAVDVDIAVAGDAKSASAVYSVTDTSYGTFVASAKVGEATETSTNGVRLVEPAAPAPARRGTRRGR